LSAAKAVIGAQNRADATTVAATIARRRRLIGKFLEFVIRRPANNFERALGFVSNSVVENGRVATSRRKLRLESPY